MDFQFKLMLYCKTGDGTVKKYAADILSDLNGDAVIDKDSSTIDLIHDGEHYISESWNLGRPDWILPQLINAADKIEKGETVMIRSAVIEGSELPYLVFESAEDQLKIWMLVFDDAEIESIFPAGPFSERAPELYRYFQEHRKELLSNIENAKTYDPAWVDTFGPLTVPKNEMLQSLSVMIFQIEELFFKN